MLKTERNTKNVERQVLQAARAILGLPRNTATKRIEAFFEHDHWWVRFYDDDNEDEPEMTYSVVDAAGGRAVNGLDLEEV